MSTPDPFSSTSMAHASKPLTIVVAATAANGIGVKGGLPWRLPKEMGHFAKVTTEAHSNSAEDGIAETDKVKRLNAVIMGRKTWESIPARFRPLKGRWNCVISRSLRTASSGSLPGEKYTSFHSSVAEAVKHLSGRIEWPAAPQDPDTAQASKVSAPEQITIDRIFLIGGAQLYTDALAPSSSSPSASQSLPSPRTTRMLLTRIISPSFDECDVHIPDVSSLAGWRQASHAAMEEWLGWEVQDGEVEEKGVRYRFEMWERDGK